MRLGTSLLASALLAAAPATAGAQEVGTYLPALELEELVQTEASSLDDYLGHTVLIEFFAYW